MGSLRVTTRVALTTHRGRLRIVLSSTYLGVIYGYHNFLRDENTNFWVRLSTNNVSLGFLVSLVLFGTR